MLQNFALKQTEELVANTSLDSQKLSLVLETLEWVPNLLIISSSDCSRLINLLWNIFELRTWGLQFVQEEEEIDPRVTMISQLHSKSNQIWKEFLSKFKSEPNFYQVGVKRVNDQVFGKLSNQILNQ